MTSVTQTIGSYNGGISQQPDQLKLPGQVKDAVNVLPDIAHGLLKRPGGRLVASLQEGELVSVANGKWFHYYRDEAEQYIGQISRTGDGFKSETHSSLVVHRVKFSFGPLGVYETTLDRVGKPSYTELYESVMADSYNANQVQFTPDSKKTVPVYEKNTNVTITLKSSHPSPATLVSMTWEGEFNNKYYRRV